MEVEAPADGNLVLRASKQPGHYVLRVATAGHVARAVVVVTK